MKFDTIFLSFAIGVCLMGGLHYLQKGETVAAIAAFVGMVMFGIGLFNK